MSGRSTARTSFRRRRRARDGTGLETGFGVVYADPNLGLIVDAALSLLVAHLAGGSTLNAAVAELLELVNPVLRADSTRPAGPSISR